MAAFNGFPATYQPMYYAPQYQPMMQQQQPAQPVQTQQPQMNSNLIWVQGEAGAKSYLVAPNTTVQLWDSEKQTIYLKSADASGMPSMKVLDYTIRDTTPVNAPVTASNAQPTNPPAYATKADVDALAGQINAIRAEVECMTKKEVTHNGKSPVSDDE